MRSRFLAAAIAVVSLTTPAFAGAAALCPPEVKQAKDLLTAKTASANAKTRGPSKVQAAARGQDEQAPRGTTAKAPRGQDEQAPRGQDEQAPRGTTAKAGRGQDEQAPRAKDRPEPPAGPVPRGQDEQAPRNVAKGRSNVLANARRLVSEAEAACKDADGQRALANAHAAMELLKYVP